MAELYLCLRKRQATFSFASETLHINQNFGIFLTMNQKGFHVLPTVLKECFRPFYITHVELGPILNFLLRLAGFNKDQELGSLVYHLIQLLPSQLKSLGITIGIGHLRDIIKEAVDSRTGSAFESDRKIFLSALSRYLLPQLTPQDKGTYQTIINNVFGISSLPAPSEQARQLVSSFAKIKGIKESPKIVASVLDAYDVVSKWRACLLTGSDGTGKQTALNIIKNLNLQMNHRHVVMNRVYPRAHSLTELYGSYYQKSSSSSATEFRHGVIHFQIKEILAEFPINVEDDKSYAVHNEKLIERWLIFDGTATHQWTETLISAIDPSNSFIIFPNYEKLKLPSNLKFIFMTPDASHLSPAETTRLGRIIVESDFDWQDYLEQKLLLMFERVSIPSQSAQERLVENIRKYFRQLFSPRSAVFGRVLNLTNLEIVRNFMIVLERLVARFLSSFYESEDHRHKLDPHFAHILFAAIGLGVGSLVIPEDRHRFEVLTSDCLFSLNMTDKFHILSKGLNFKTFYSDFCTKIFNPDLVDLTLLDENQSKSQFEVLRILSPQDLWSVQVTSEVVRSRQHVMFLGSANSPLKQRLLRVKQAAAGFGVTHQVHITFDAYFAGKQLVDWLRTSMMPKTRKAYVPRSNQMTLLTLDDINMPHLDAFQEIGALDMVRCLLKENSFVDHFQTERIEFEGLQYLLSFDPDRKPLSVVPLRLRRHFFISPAHSFDEHDYKTSIYQFVLRRCPQMFVEGMNSGSFPAIATRASELVFQLQDCLAHLMARVGKLQKGTIALPRVLDLLTSMLAVKHSFSMDQGLTFHLINQFIDYGKNLSDGLAYEAGLEEAIRQGTMKALKNFNWDEFEPTPFSVTHTIKADTEIVMRVTNPPQNEVGKLKADVDSMLQQDKRLVRPSDFFLMEESYDLIYRMIHCLAAPGASIIMSSPSGRGKQHFAKVASHFIHFELVPIEMEDGPLQYDSFTGELGKWVLHSLENKAYICLFLNLSKIEDPKVMSCIQRVFRLFDLSCLPIESSKIKDCMVLLNYEIEELDFIQGHLRKYFRVIYSQDSSEAEARHEVQADIRSTGSRALDRTPTTHFDLRQDFESFFSEFSILELAEWTPKNFKHACLEIFDNQEDIEMTITEQEVCAQALIAFYRDVKLAVGSVSPLSGSGLQVGPKSFVSTCEYMCSIKVRAQADIKDQLRSLQTGLNRYKTLLKLFEELKENEARMEPILEQQEATIQQLIEQIEQDSTSFEVGRE